jgi:UDP-N-acetylmuramoyl-tripeptide--D-alanyl-D-alanine ligase
MLIKEIYDIFLQCTGVTTDSRKVKKDNLFVALKGANFNGNAYAEKALNDGAAYAIVDEAAYQKDDRFLLVDDGLETLQNLATFHRKQLKAAVIAITGSNGKTTTKELLCEVLKQKYKTGATKGNFNNHIGVPLTLLSFPNDVEMAVVEMGANHLNEINALCAIALPNFGLITSIGKAHLEGFGGPEGVRKAKGELFEYLEAANARTFVNLNDTNIAELAYYIQKASTYGTGKWAKTNGEIAGLTPFLSVKWFPRKKHKYHPDIEPLSINTQLVGAYNLDNVLAAIAVGSHFMVGPEQIKSAIEGYAPTNNRSQVLQQGSNTFILDAYNANPTSMQKALDNLKQIEAANKGVVLGDMLELGAYSDTEHQLIVNQLLSMELNCVVLVGKAFRQCSLGTTDKIKHFDNSKLAKEWFQQQQFDNMYWLVKGSRAMQLEQLVVTSV